MRAPLILVFGLASLATGDGAAQARQPDACLAPDVTRDMAIPNPTCAQKWSYHTYRQIAVANFGGWNGWVQAAIEGEVSAYQIRSNAIALTAAVTNFSHSKNVIDIYVQAHVEVPRLALQLIPNDSKGAIFANKLMAFLLTTIDAGIEAGTTASTPVDIAPDLAGLINDIWAYFKVTGLLQKQDALLIAQGYLTDLYRFGDNPNLLAQSYGLASSASFEERIKAVAKQKYGMTNTVFKQDFDLVATARTIEYVRSNLVSKVVVLCESGECKTALGPSTSASLPAITGPDVKALAYPPTLMVQVDLCLLYKCGVRLKVNKSLTVFAAPDSASPQIGSLAPGSEFEPQSAAWITTQPQVVKVLQRRAAEQNAAYWFEPGELIYLYAYWGEGCWTTWTRGYLYGSFDEGHRPGGNDVVRKDLINCLMIDANPPGVEEVQRGESVLWIALKINDGRIGWIRSEKGNPEAAG